MRNWRPEWNYDFDCVILIFIFAPQIKEKQDRVLPWLRSIHVDQLTASAT